MGMILYSPAFKKENVDSYWDSPKMYIMTMDDYRHWRQKHPQCKNAACFLPINVQISLAYRQFYTQNLVLVKPEQGKTKKAPIKTLVCEPLNDIETFYLFNYHGRKVPQYSSKKVAEYVTNIHKARYYLAQSSLKRSGGKINTMYNIADLYDNRYLQNELELPLDRDQDYNIYFANNRIRREIEDQLECFQSEIFIAQHGEAVGRFFHITEAPKQTEIRLNTQTKLNLTEHTFNTSVRGTFVNLPVNFRNRYQIPEGGHLGHKQTEPEKPKIPSVILNSSIIDITSPARSKPVYEIKTGDKTLKVSSTYKSNFSPFKSKSEKPGTTAATKSIIPEKPKAKIDEIKPDIGGSGKKLSPKNEPPGTRSEVIGTAKITNAGNIQSVQTGKTKSKTIKTNTAEFNISSNISETKLSGNPVSPTSSRKTSVSSDSVTLILSSDESNNDDNKNPNQSSKITTNSAKSEPKPKPKPKPETDFITELCKPLVTKSRTSSDNSNATTYSELFQNEHITFDLNTNRSDQASITNSSDYADMHNLSENLRNMQINFKNQLDQLLEDYQKITIDNRHKIVPDSSQNLAFLNDINQLISAIDNNKHKAVDIRQHVLETITNIINRHFHNPSGPLDPSKINIDQVNPNNLMQRSAVAYLENIRDNIIKIKPPLSSTTPNTPYADKQIAKITNEFYESIEPLVKCIYEQFDEAKEAIEKTITETNLGLSKHLVPIENTDKTPHKNIPKPNISEIPRRSGRLQKKATVDMKDRSSSNEDERETKNLPLTSTVKRDKRPTSVKSLPNTPNRKPPLKTKTEPIARKQKVRFDIKTKLPKINENTKPGTSENPNKTINPEVPDSLYNLCDPTMPPLEEIATNSQDRPLKRKTRKNSDSDTDSPIIDKKKPKTDKPKYMITDSEEEI